MRKSRHTCRGQHPTTILYIIPDGRSHPRHISPRHVTSGDCHVTHPLPPPTPLSSRGRDTPTSSVAISSPVVPCPVAPVMAGRRGAQLRTMVHDAATDLK